MACNLTYLLKVFSACRSFVFCCILGTVSSVFAGATNGMLGQNSLQAGLDAYYYTYSENVAPTLELLGVNHYKGQPKSDEFGTTFAFSLGGIGFERITRLFGSFFFEAGGGTHTYDGARQDSSVIEGTDTFRVFVPMDTTKSNSFLKFGLCVGPYFTFGRCLIGLQGGIEYHSWNRSLNGGTSEKYWWYYFPVKLHTEFLLSQRTTIGCNLTYRLMLSGTMEMQSLAFTYYGIEAPAVNLSQKQGFFAELPLQTNLNRYFNFECKPWFEYRPSGISNIETMRYRSNSQPIAYYVEPESSSYSIGCTISIIYGDFRSVKGR